MQSLRVNEAAALPSPAVVLSARLQQYYGRLRRPPSTKPTSRRQPVIGPASPVTTRRSPGRGGPPQFPSSLSERSTPHTPEGSWRLRFQVLHRVHGLHRDSSGSAPSDPTLTGGDVNDAAGFASCCGPSSCSPKRAFDTGLRPGPFPTRDASLLPGLLTATRTGLTPASDDEHEQRNHPAKSRGHLPVRLGARN